MRSGRKQTRDLKTLSFERMRLLVAHCLDARDRMISVYLRAKLQIFYFKICDMITVEIKYSHFWVVTRYAVPTHRVVIYYS